jgi:hypothetical protein
MVVPVTESRIKQVISTIVGIAILVALLLVVMIGSDILFHNQFPITKEYREVNVTERIALRSEGVLITDTDEKITVSPWIFWEAHPGNRYRLEYTYNSSSLDTLPSSKGIQQYPRITNITLVKK